MYVTYIKKKSNSLFIIILHYFIWKPAILRNVLLNFLVSSWFDFVNFIIKGPFTYYVCGRGGQKNWQNVELAIASFANVLYLGFFCSIVRNWNFQLKFTIIVDIYWSFKNSINLMWAIYIQCNLYDHIFNESFLNEFHVSRNTSCTIVAFFLLVGCSRCWSSLYYSLYDQRSFRRLQDFKRFSQSEWRWRIFVHFFQYLF